MSRSRHVFNNRDEVTKFLKELISESGLGKYKHRLGVVHYPIEQHSKSTCDFRQYHWYRCYYEFIEDLNQEIGMFKVYRIGIYLSESKLWLPLFEFSSTKYDSDSPETLVKLAPLYKARGFQDGNIYELKTFPLKVRYIPRKLKMCVKFVGKSVDDNYTKTIDKINNIKKLANKL